MNGFGCQEWWLREMLLRENYGWRNDSVDCICGEVKGEFSEDVGVQT